MKNSNRKYTKIANDIRKHAVKMHSCADTSHIGSSFSCVEILVSLYFSILRINPKKPNDVNSDKFILSKGHAASVLYAALAMKGFGSKKILENYCCSGSPLPGHATKNCMPGVIVSTGSLGHGLPIAAGMALAGKYDKKNYRVFVLLSDGECDEGSVWEAALFAGYHKLDNLTVIIDYNKLQAFGRTNEILNLEPLSGKWKAFGWSAKEINGHDFAEIIPTLQKLPFRKDKPNVVIAHTTKGKGVSFMEDKLAWHYKAPIGTHFKEAMKELSTK